MFLLSFLPKLLTEDFDYYMYTFVCLFVSTLIHYQISLTKIIVNGTIYLQYSFAQTHVNSLNVDLAVLRSK